MKQLTNHTIIICTVVLAMLCSLFMPFSSMAAGGALIKIKGFSTEATKPTPVTSETVNISVEINNIDDDKLASIYYEIENVTTNPGKPVENKSNKGVKTTPYELTFNNVKLSEGTNKVTFVMGDASKISSQPAYITFTPTTNITDLKFNDVPMEDSKMYPKDPAQSAYTITGKSPNATTVKGYLLGQSNSISAFRSNNGDFTFIPNRGSDFNMQGGDNIFKIVASNNTNMYTTTRKFIFNNGKPFLFEGALEAGGTTQKLINDPFPQLNQTTVNLKGKMKVNLIPGSTTVTEYVYADIQVVNGNTTRVYFSGKAPVLQEIPGESTPFYKVYDLGSIPLTLPVNRKQTMIVTFYTGSGLVGQAPQQTFTFSYFDPNAPYVTKVTKDLGVDKVTNQPVEVVLNENGDNEISELPSTFYVYTTGINPPSGSPAGNVVARITGATDINATYVGQDGTQQKWKFQIEGVRDGKTSLSVVPNGNNNGRLDFPLVITSAPYLIPVNFYNNMVIKNAASDTPYCNPGTGGMPCLQARIMNLPTSEYGNVEVSVNGYATKLVASDFRDPAAKSTFMLDVTKADSRWVPNDGKELLKEGRNTIKINLKLHGGIVTTVQYEIFKFTLPTPQFVGDILPNPLDKFTKAQTNDKYVTHSNSVSFVGSFVNADSIKMTVRKKDAQGKPLVTFDHRDSSNGWGYPANPASGQQNYLNSVSSGTINTAVISLPFQGDVIFEFMISNKSGITETRTITISREPVPYRIIEPILVKTNKEEVANINGNFVDIKLEAENADSVTFDKNIRVLSKIDPSDNKPYFYYRYENLKAGHNVINFTVNRGKESSKGSFNVNNVNTAVEGAQMLLPMQTKIKMFEGELELDFPKDTKLMRNDPGATNTYLTGERKLLFGLANAKDGRVNKSYNTDYNASFFLQEPTGKFRPASKLFWINGGTINQDDYLDKDKLKEALTGSGRDPYNIDPNSSNVRFYQKNNENELKNMVVPSKRGKLTLKYDNLMRDDAWKYVTIYQLDIYEDYRGMTALAWKNIGGVVDLKKNTITAPIDHFGYFQVMYMYDSFNDITSHEWGRDTLDTMYSKGFMLNKLQSLFVPNEPITRGEFATLLVKGFDIPLQYTGNMTFSDVQKFSSSNPLYDYKYIETAARVGIARGGAGGRFKPDESITRQDAAVMIARAAEMKINSDGAKSLTNLQKQFTDAKDIDIYAGASIEAVSKAGFITGIENVLLPGQKKKTYRFDPRQNLTRVQAAAVFERVLKQQKKFPK
ncbi:hypothetical protein AV654_05820 [Paenibacillus elgii]|uniref:SLH domain-containing protein n=1 Tax=Paenibacillus elgii TaxID=189691 RepID=A0A161S0B9_9BACL|nr:S-layer homology domain-containing protein [Paenibacillus elgii]KZE71722.1 hypothetical protein AV654_05820 [Paenibacillus elgii]